MVQIKKLTFKRKNDIFHMEVVILCKEDIEYVKNFVLTQYNYFDRKDYFIIDDLDTELPCIFEKDIGIIYGILYKSNLVALQAIDFSENNDKMLRPYVQRFINKDCKIYELGWTLVKKEFRGFHIADYLINYAEKQILNESDYILVATVHPENTKALQLFFRNGFSGYLLDEYYGYIRIFLINNPIPENIHSQICVEPTNFEKIKELFSNGYVCSNIVSSSNKVYLSLGIPNSQ